MMMAMYKGVNYDDVQSIYKHMQKAEIALMKALIKYKDLKLSYIEKAKEEGIYNPKLMKKLMEISVEV